MRPRASQCAEISTYSIKVEPLLSVCQVHRLRIANIRKETALLASVEHNAVVRVLGLLRARGRPDSIVLERCGGCLADWIM